MHGQHENVLENAAPAPNWRVVRPDGDVNDVQPCTPPCHMQDVAQDGNGLGVTPIV
eukprot:CAMPEP_0183594214 /NCGR_PEP_ID=MMETSP0371-20130417/171261_1 /TAXON_ID=268820 /ORGANISM="Peridinium aciculiferum, Strain PAER-2" /LENGTH=55 /DNA_ID=CAMNT_0025805901 /DNA_START=110 /DNA_END=277 /DNA_ORIENTATION=+